MLLQAIVFYFLCQPNTQYMKQLLIAFALGLSLLTACLPQANKSKGADAELIEGATPGKIEFETDFHDFGTLQAGEVVSVSFKFKNTGESSLLIRGVRASCGCTSTGYTQAPVAPGGEGEVSLQFDSSGFRGMQNKSATVITNGQPADIKLHFTAVVEVPGEE